jgi:hypothetical protein
VDLTLKLLTIQLEDETLGHLPADLPLLISDGARAGEPGSGVALDLQRGFPDFPPVSRTFYVALGSTLCLCYGITSSRFGTSFSPRYHATFVVRTCFCLHILSALRFAGGLRPNSLLAAGASNQSKKRDGGEQGPDLTTSQRPGCRLNQPSSFRRRCAPSCLSIPQAGSRLEKFD